MRLLNERLVYVAQKGFRILRVPLIILQKIQAAAMVRCFLLIRAQQTGQMRFRTWGYLFRDGRYSLLGCLKGQSLNMTVRQSTSTLGSVYSIKVPMMSSDCNAIRVIQKHVHR